MSSPTTSAVLSTHITPLKASADQQSVAEQVKQANMDVEKAADLSKASILTQQVARLDLVTSQLDEIKKWGRATAETAAFQLVVEKAEANAARLTALDDETTKEQEAILESLNSASLKLRTLSEQIQADQISINEERVTSEALKEYREALKDENTAVMKERAENNRRLKELNKMDADDQAKASAKKRQQLQEYSRNLKIKVQRQEHRLQDIKQDLKEATKEFEELERAKAFQRRVTQPTKASRAAVKRQLQHIVPHNQEISDEESTDDLSMEPPTKKKYIEVYGSLSKKLPSIVMVPEKMLKKQKQEDKDRP